MPDDNTGDNQGTGGNQGASNAGYGDSVGGQGFGGGASAIDAMAAGSNAASQMSFSSADFATLSGLGLVGASAVATTGPVAGTVATVGAALMDAGPVASAVGNAVHDASVGFGLLSADANVDIFAASSADFGTGNNSNDSSTPFAVNLGGGQIAEFSGAGALIDVIRDPAYWAASTGSEGGGVG